MTLFLLAHFGLCFEASLPKLIDSECLNFKRGRLKFCDGPIIGVEVCCQQRKFLGTSVVKQIARTRVPQLLVSATIFTNERTFF